MDGLPLEIFLRVMTFLDHNEKVDTLNVSKTWCANVQKNTRLYNVVIIDDYQQFTSFYSFFDKHVDLRDQVKHLTVQDTNIGVCALFMLPVLFPLLETFSFTNKLAPIRDWDQDEADKQFVHWASIRAIEETDSPIAAPSLLATRLCPHLVSLSLGFVGYEDELKKRDFIQHLGNAPNLTHLRVQWLNVTLEDVETLLNNAPHLQALGFYEVGFEPGQMKDSIVPQNSLETLCIDTGYFAGIGDDWIPYFAKKCPRMKHFMLTLNVEDDVYPPPPHLETQLAHLLKTCDFLEYYHAAPMSLTETIVKAMNSNEKLKLKKIILGGYDVSSELRWLIKSNQKNNIESLTLSGMAYSVLEGEVGSERKFFSTMAEFSKLKHLRINESREEVLGQESNHVPLDAFLEFLNLESLIMDFATFDVADTSDTPFSTNLKKLVLEECYVEAKKFKHLNPERPLFGSFNYQQEQLFHDESMEFLKETKLPNTDVIQRGMDDKSGDEEYAHFFWVAV